MIAFHEFGHFVFARLNKIVVHEFSIGFGPKLFSIKGKETTFSLKLIPFGGACMMKGEDEDDDSEGSFNSKSVWRRMTVVLAGPIFNFIMAFVFAIIVFAGTGVQTTEIGSVVAGSPAEEAGVQAGDVLVKINGKSVHQFKEISVYRFFHPSDNYDLTLERNGERFEVNVGTYDSGENTGLLGVVSNYPVKQGIGGLIKYGYYEVKYNISVVIQSLKALVTGKASLRDMSGPVGMVSMIGESYGEASSAGAYAVFLTMASWIVLLSANLGVMNLLPIPALDGGRFLFLIIEAIRRKPFDRNKEGLVNLIGFILLIALMVIILVSDVSKLF